MKKNKQSGKKQNLAINHSIYESSKVLQFDTTFDRSLLPNNRWVQLEKLVPWDSLVSKYDALFLDLSDGNAFNSRVKIAAIIAKYILNLTDHQTTLLINENIYVQYFLGHNAFSYDQLISTNQLSEWRKKIEPEIITDIKNFTTLHYAEINDLFNIQHIDAL
jgi:IS5 family transposase